MEVPAEVHVYSETLGVKGSKGTLLQVAAGYYEINLQFAERMHRALLPMQGTVLVSREPEVAVGGEPMEIER